MSNASRTLVQVERSGSQLPFFQRVHEERLMPAALQRSSTLLPARPNANSISIICFGMLIVPQSICTAARLSSALQMAKHTAVRHGAPHVW